MICENIIIRRNINNIPKKTSDKYCVGKQFLLDLARLENLPNIESHSKSSHEDIRNLIPFSAQINTSSNC